MAAEYRTSEVARIIGIHPNTVRLYEELELIPKPRRAENGYRIFTEYHIIQFRLARTILRVEVMQNGLRETAFDLIRASASGSLGEARALAGDYLGQVRQEEHAAEEAIRITERLLDGESDTGQADTGCMTRKDAAALLRVSVDALRNWERNGLLPDTSLKRGRRSYSTEEIRRLKVVRCLRSANYSLSAIRRMMHTVYGDPDADLVAVIDTPKETDDIISVCDRLLTSLRHAGENAVQVLRYLDQLEGHPYP